MNSIPLEVSLNVHTEYATHAELCFVRLETRTPLPMYKCVCIDYE